MSPAPATKGPREGLLVFFNDETQRLLLMPQEFTLRRRDLLRILSFSTEKGPKHVPQRTATTGFVVVFVAEAVIAEVRQADPRAENNPERV